MMVATPPASGEESTENAVLIGDFKHFDVQQIVILCQQKHS